jgi:hypothetical protein
MGPEEIVTMNEGGNSLAGFLWATVFIQVDFMLFIVRQNRSI